MIPVNGCSLPVDERRRIPDRISGSRVFRKRVSSVVCARNCARDRTAVVVFSRDSYAFFFSQAVCAGCGRTPLVFPQTRSPAPRLANSSPEYERVHCPGDKKSEKKERKEKEEKTTRAKRKKNRKKKTKRIEKKAGVKERERARKAFSDVARKTCSHTRTQWRKSLTWMIAADQLVGREVSFSKSGFQFPKGAYRVPTESPPSEFASGVTLPARAELLENETRPQNTGECLFYQVSLSPLDFPSLGWPVDGTDAA